jgi:hypothetical protein
VVELILRQTIVNGVIQFDSKLLNYLREQGLISEEVAQTE